LCGTNRRALRRDLVELQARHNVAPRPDETDTPAEYLEVYALRAESNGTNQA